jgi:hypothetical protein
VSIRLAAFEESGDSFVPTRPEWTVRPNDPLYLMKGTSAPEPYDQQPAFDFLDQDELKIKYDGKDHVIKLRYSITKPEPRQKGGNSHIGRHAAKNQGVSVVRAHRELEMNSSFDNRSEPRDRWWGVEVLFDPALDDVFGVTNNKQSATFFTRLDLDEDARIEGLTPGDYRERLEESNDPRLVIYDLSSKIDKILREVIRPQIERNAKLRKHGKYAPEPGSAEELATRATQKRRDDIGDKGASDQGEKLPVTQREKELENELVAVGVPEPEAKEIAVEYVKSNVKFLFQEAEINGPVIFDVKSKAGTIIVNINTKHPAREHLFELLKEGSAETETPALKALKLLLMSWARLEDEAGA